MYVLAAGGSGQEGVPQRGSELHGAGALHHTLWLEEAALTAIALRGGGLQTEASRSKSDILLSTKEANEREVTLRLHLGFSRR